MIQSEIAKLFSDFYAAQQAGDYVEAFGNLWPKIQEKIKLKEAEETEAGEAFEEYLDDKGIGLGSEFDYGLLGHNSMLIRALSQFQKLTEDQVQKLTIDSEARLREFLAETYGEEKITALSDTYGVGKNDVITMLTEIISKEDAIEEIKLGLANGSIADAEFEDVEALMEHFDKEMQQDIDVVMKSNLSEIVVQRLVTSAAENSGKTFDKYLSEKVLEAADNINLSDDQKKNLFDDNGVPTEQAMMLLINDDEVLSSMGIENPDAIEDLRLKLAFAMKENAIESRLAYTTREALVDEDVMHGLNFEVAMKAEVSEAEKDELCTTGYCVNKTVNAEGDTIRSVEAYHRLPDGRKIEGEGAYHEDAQEYQNLVDSFKSIPTPPLHRVGPAEISR